MPNRILKESICTSENIDQLSPWAEIAFYRLMVNCDDYGRMDARAKILKSRLFPLKDVSEGDIMIWLKELTGADLITVYDVDGKPYLQMKTWDRHQQVRAKRSKYPSPDDNTCNQMISNAIKSPRNPIQSLSESESLSLSKPLMDDDDAKKIQNDHDRVLNAAEDAGFKMSNDVRTSLIAFYATYGLEKVLDGFKACVKHSAVNLAYLEAVLKGKPKEVKPRVIAQDFDQRDYSGVQEQIMKDQAEKIRAFLAKKEVG